MPQTSSLFQEHERPLVPLRILVLGRSTVGKSTIIDWLKRFNQTKGSFNEVALRETLQFRPRTIDPPQSLKTSLLLSPRLISMMETLLRTKASIVEKLNSQGVLLHVYDFGGQLTLLRQARTGAVPLHIYRSADLIIWVVDGSRKNRLEKAYKEFIEFRELCPESRAVIFLNKWDLPHQVSVQDIVDTFGVHESNIFTTSVPRWDTLVATFYELICRLQAPPEQIDYQYRKEAKDEGPLVWELEDEERFADLDKMSTVFSRALEVDGFERGSLVDLEAGRYLVDSLSHPDADIVKPCRMIVRGLQEISKIYGIDAGKNGQTSIFSNDSSHGDELFLHYSFDTPSLLSLGVKRAKEYAALHERFSTLFDAFKGLDLL